MSVTSLVQKILDEEYLAGEPWKLPKGTGFVLPILGSPPFSVRNYVLLQEVEDKVDFKDTGGIRGVSVTNRSDKNVYIRKGTMLKGQGTQSRSPISGVVIEPSSIEVEIPVNCIHASHGIRSNAIFYAGGLAPHSVYQSLGNQSETWQSISNHTETLRAGVWATRASPQTRHALSALSFDNLTGYSDIIEEMKDTVEDVLKNIPGDHINQVGIAVFDLKGIIGLEIFDSPESWKAFSKSIIRSYAEVLTEESELYEIKTEKAVSVLMTFLKKASEADRILITSNKISKTWKLTADKIEGELIEVENKEIHLVLARCEDEQKKSYFPSITSIGTPRTRRTEPINPNIYINNIYTANDLPLWLRKKGSGSILNSLDERPMRFKELLEDLPISRGTLSSRINEAKDMGLIKNIYRIENGVPAYSLTDIGKETKKKIQNKIF